MNSGRPYRQREREASRELTRERILEAAEGLYRGSWYDEVTLRDVARVAGVALQTVVNHFGTKANLAAAVVLRVGGRIDSRREEIAAGDTAGGVAMLVDEYEKLGDSIVRMLALEERIPDVNALLAVGRRAHRTWVERVFAEALPAQPGAERDRWIAMLVAATDVLTWKLLRRDQGLSRLATRRAMRDTVEALTSGQKASR